MLRTRLSTEAAAKVPQFAISYEPDVVKAAYLRTLHQSERRWEPFDTGSPTGRMMLQMPGVFAEFEYATIVDRVTAGLERRVREGRWMSGRTPRATPAPMGFLSPTR